MLTIIPPEVLECFDNIIAFMQKDIKTQFEDFVQATNEYNTSIAQIQEFINNQGKKDENVLTYLARYYCDCTKLIDVSLTNFIPQPNIESMVIKFTKKENELKVLDDKKFLDVTKALLKMRRKTIQNNLNAYLPSKNDVKEVLDDLNIDPLTRAESLTLEDFIKITNKICEKYPRQ